LNKHFAQTLLLSSAVAVATTSWAADATQTHEMNQHQSYSYATEGVADKIEGKWKLLLDESNLGGKELEMAEITIPAGTTIASHTHRPIEVIYVLSGTYGHEVNGHLYLLKPGMVGVVRPGDHVRHIVPKEADAKLLIIWAPGGEAARIFDASKGTTIKKLTEVKAQ
jgi:quercetin dioxygenase-like cupin family protein